MPYSCTVTATANLLISEGDILFDWYNSKEYRKRGRIRCHWVAAIYGLLYSAYGVRGDGAEVLAAVCGGRGAGIVSSHGQLVELRLNCGEAAMGTLKKKKYIFF